MKRYTIYSFPSLFGTPWQVNFYLVAWLVALFRTVAAGGTREIRIVDNKTEKHIIF